MKAAYHKEEHFAARKKAEQQRDEKTRDWTFFIAKYVIAINGHIN